jgi:hypothetical protein
MAVPDEREIEVIEESVLGAPIRERSAEQRPAKAGDHLHVAERGHVQIGLTFAEDRPDRAGRFRAEEVFEERRCVSDDDPQEASLAARSSWISSAAGRPSFTCRLASILSNTSAAGGLAISRSRSSWM